jgi:3-hydroxymyristoyl/3-hydroxydecanoyl-(acyl carrier protein) dehydratase
MAAYMGSALLSPIDLRFRNLGGTAEQLRPLTEEAGTLTTRVKVTQVSHSGPIIIQHCDFAIFDAAGEVYRGNTYFGFFSDENLTQQVGIRDAALYKPRADELRRSRRFAYPVEAPFPDRHFRMIDRIDLYIPDAGVGGLGFIEGSINVDADAWFFQAHFYQDPVWPGSLGLEAFWQLLKVNALDKLGGGPESRFVTPSPHTTHRWVYRGQVIPANVRVTVQASLTAVDPQTRTLTADGWLTVDGLVIYQMQGFSLTVA